MFSVISVVKDDDWALTKTLMSIFNQDFSDIEVIVVDGASSDQTKSIVEFWADYGLIDHYICEADSSVYDAMNKGVLFASGEYSIFMNAGDVFANNNTLSKVSSVLLENNSDGVLGWGALSEQIWSSWVINEAFAIASLGFCHQSLYLRTKLIKHNPFDSRSFKTDSDTLQLSRIAETSNIARLPQVLSVRSSDQGISADQKKTSISIIDTISSQYDVSYYVARSILEFRRHCKSPSEILELLNKHNGKLAVHLAFLVLDTLFLKQSNILEPYYAKCLLKSALSVLGHEPSIDVKQVVQDLIECQYLRANYISEIRLAKNEKAASTAKLDQVIKDKLHHTKAAISDVDYYVSLTSFPKRIDSLYLVIESLLRQTIPPKKIYLTLGRDEIRGEGWLPANLRRLKSDGLVINFIDKTRHQYDKYLHTCDENQRLPMIIVDDDVIYPVRSMEYLLRSHLAYPSCVVANRAHRISIDSNYHIEPYSNWKKEIGSCLPSHLVFPTGAGGVLYPPGFFDKDLTCNEEYILKFAPYADDVWLKVCSFYKGVKAVPSTMIDNEPWYFRYTPSMEEGALHKTNVDKGTNDYQLQRSLDFLIPYFDLQTVE